MLLLGGERAQRRASAWMVLVVLCESLGVGTWHAPLDQEAGAITR